ncbi:MAG: hypothetical protein SNJ71_00615 [Bacteroidales bacterium]
MFKPKDIVRNRKYPHRLGEVIAITKDGRVVVCWNDDGFISESRSRQLEIYQRFPEEEEDYEEEFYY